MNQLKYEQEYAHFLSIHLIADNIVLIKNAPQRSFSSFNIISIYSIHLLSNQNQGLLLFWNYFWQARKRKTSKSESSHDAQAPHEVIHFPHDKKYKPSTK